MDFEFSSKKLKELYTTGKSKKFPYPKHIIKKFIMRVQSIEAALTIYDLRMPPSNRFERLKGTENEFSMRLQNKYRIVFNINFEDSEKTIGKVTITDINNHYGD